MYGRNIWSLEVLMTDKPCTSRPSSTTPKQDRVLTWMFLQRRYLTAPQLRLSRKETCDISVSTSTVKSIFASAGLHGYIARRKPLLTAIIVSSASNLPRSTRHGLTKTGKEWYGVMSVNVTCLEVMVGRISGDEYQKSL